jgi:hypothetical protein
MQDPAEMRIELYSQSAMRRYLSIQIASKASHSEPKENEVIFINGANAPAATDDQQRCLKTSPNPLSDPQ